MFLSDRLPQRREHKGIQVAPYRLFARLALHLQSPTPFRRRPHRGPSGGLSGDPNRGGAPLGGPRGASRATYRGIPRGAPREDLEGGPLGGPHMEQQTGQDDYSFLGVPREGSIRGAPRGKGKHPPPLLFEVTSPDLICRVVSSACSLGLPLFHLYRLVCLKAKKERAFFHLEHLISIAKSDVSPSLPLPDVAAVDALLDAVTIPHTSCASLSL